MRLTAEEKRTVGPETRGSQRAESRGKVEVAVMMFMARKRSRRA
jgi:hypothetical protein